MATNRIFHGVTDTLSLPVPDGTVSGDPLVIGDLPCVALTDRATSADDNPVDEATVQVYPSAVFEFEVIGNDGTAGAAVAVGEAVYLQADGTIDVDTAGTLFGYALQAVASGATTTVRVKLAAV